MKQHCREQVLDWQNCPAILSMPHKCGKCLVTPFNFQGSFKDRRDGHKPTGSAGPGAQIIWWLVSFGCQLHRGCQTMLLPLAEVLASNSSSCHQTATGWAKRVPGGNTASERVGKQGSFEQPLDYSSLAPSGQRKLLLHEAWTQNKSWHWRKANCNTPVTA